MFLLFLVFGNFLDAQGLIGTFEFPFCQPLWALTKCQDAIVVADMEVDTVADMELDMEEDKVADMEVYMVIDIDIKMEIQFGERFGKRELANWAQTFSTRSLPSLRIF